MKLADVSVRRPVFALMMTAALIVLGAFSYKDLGLDLMPKTDSPVVNVQVPACPAPAPRRSRPRSPSGSRRRSTPSAASTSCAPAPTRATRDGHHHLHARARHRSRRPRTSATRSRPSSASFPRDTRPPRDPEGRSRRAADSARSRSTGRAIAEGDHRDRRQADQAGPRDGRGRRLDQLQRRAQARDPAAAERRPAERLRPDRRSGADRGRAPERRDARRQLHRRPVRGRAAHDGPDQRRRRLQPDRPDLPGRLGRSRSATSAACRTASRKSRSATRLNGEPAVGIQVRKQSGTNTVEVVDRVLARLEQIQTTLPPDLTISIGSDQSRVHPPVVRRHQAAPDPRRPAGRRGGVPVHPQPARHGHRRAGHPDVDHRHLHRHEDRSASR